MKPILKLFTDAELELTRNTVRNVLAKKGLRFVNPEVLDVFRKNGFEIKDDVVFIPAGIPHWYNAEGDEPFEFLCIVPNIPDKLKMVDKK